MVQRRNYRRNAAAVVCTLLMLGLPGIFLSGCQVQGASGRNQAAGAFDADVNGRTEDTWKNSAAGIQGNSDQENSVQENSVQENSSQESMSEEYTISEENSIWKENPIWKEQPVVLQNLNMDGSIFTQTYYKAGDSNCRMCGFVLPGEVGDSFLSDTFELTVTRQSPCFDEEAGQEVLSVNGNITVKTIPNQNVYQTELEIYGYQNGETVLEESYTVEVSLPSGDDPAGAVTIQLSDASDEVYPEAEALMGEYYHIPLLEDWTERYHCRAELRDCSTEELRLMRNTIYAAHGRRFQSQELTDYMEAQPWYRGNIDPSDFSEVVLSDVEKKNIALLLEAEKQLSDGQKAADSDSFGTEGQEEAPYLPLLSQNKETGLSASMEQAEDCGDYYRVPGKLYLPVTITRKQWEDVKNGGKAELCVNELTGESKILEYDSVHGYRFYKKGAVLEDFGMSDIWCSYNYDTRLYELKELSDDTIMKPVYEGELFLLKGAVCGGMVSLTSSSRIQQEITPETSFVYGNCLYHDSRGYFTAIYALGD